MSGSEAGSKGYYDWLKKPIPVTQDGVTCIVVHEKAQTELGRLLSLKAKVPFAIYGKPNPMSDSGAWETLQDAILCHGNVAMVKWMDSYSLGEAPEHLVYKEKETLKEWFCEKIQQNWYLLELLVNEKLPFVFVYHDTKTDENGVRCYVPMPAFEFVQHTIRNLRTDTRLKWKSNKDKEVKRETKRVLKGKPPIARQKPIKVNKDEDCQTKRKRD